MEAETRARNGWGGGALTAGEVAIRREKQETACVRASKLIKRENGLVGSASSRRIAFAWARFTGASALPRFNAPVSDWWGGDRRGEQAGPACE